MADKYAVIRTDLMSGVKQPADLVSVRYFTATDGEEAAVENGVIVELKGYLDGEREIFKGIPATAGSDLNACAILDAPEVDYDERKRNGAAPAVGGKVGIGAGGKLTASGTGFGTCVAIENAGRYTYYVIEIGKTEK